MSTRCQIEFYDRYQDRETLKWKWCEKPAAILYHHSDGMPDFMVDKLQRFLRGAQKYLEECGQPHWDAERVATAMIPLSIEDYEVPLKPFSTDRANRYVSGMPWDAKYRNSGGFPEFVACTSLHGDIDYLYRVYLENFGQYRLKVFRTLDADRELFEEIGMRELKQILEEAARRKAERLKQVAPKKKARKRVLIPEI